MKLPTAHRILMRSAIVFGGIYTVWSFWMGIKYGGVTNWVVGVLSAGATMALVSYLKKFNKRFPPR